jgi:hypothetical protein
LTGASGKEPSWTTGHLGRRSWLCYHWDPHYPPVRVNPPPGGFTTCARCHYLPCWLQAHVSHFQPLSPLLC